MTSFNGIDKSCLVVHEIRWFSGSLWGFWNIVEDRLLVVQGLHWALETAFILEGVLPLEHIYPIYYDLRFLLSSFTIYN